MIAIPEELLDQLERGNVLLFIGDRVVRDATGIALYDEIRTRIAARSGAHRR